MGSTDATLNMPDASSASLVTTHPTKEEQRQIWTMNHAEWGGALSLEDYLVREPYLTTIPLTEQGGMVHWILTDSDDSSQPRKLLAACESLRKRTLVADADGNVSEGIAYGIASVYTPPEFRGRRYASRMLRDVSERLAKGANGDGAPVASALWSDIGKQFYARLQWLPFPSLHVCFRVADGVEGSQGSDGPVKTAAITYENLESYCKADEVLLRRKMGEKGSGKTRFAFTPDFDILRWHLFRGDFIHKKVFAGTEAPATKGVVAGEDGSRVWAVWSRNYHGDASDPSRNTLYILRLVVENEEAPKEEMRRNFDAVLRAARQEATRWKSGKMDLWNPDPTVKSLVEGSGMKFDWVDREKDSIPSLMWLGDGDKDGVEWVGNEKYCWN